MVRLLWGGYQLFLAVIYGGSDFKGYQRFALGLCVIFQRHSELTDKCVALFADAFYG